MRPLTTDMGSRRLRPYFLWDEDVSVDELRAILAGPDSGRRRQLMGKMLREARDPDPIGGRHPPGPARSRRGGTVPGVSVRATPPPVRVRLASGRNL